MGAARPVECPIYRASLPAPIMHQRRSDAYNTHPVGRDLMLLLVLFGLGICLVVAILISEACELDNDNYLDVLGDIYEDAQ